MIEQLVFVKLITSITYQKQSIFTDFADIVKLCRRLCADNDDGSPGKLIKDNQLLGNHDISACPLSIPICNIMGVSVSFLYLHGQLNDQVLNFF